MWEIRNKSLSKTSSMNGIHNKHAFIEHSLWSNEEQAAMQRETEMILFLLFLCTLYMSCTFILCDHLAQTLYYHSFNATLVGNSCPVIECMYTCTIQNITTNEASILIITFLHCTDLYSQIMARVAKKVNCSCKNNNLLLYSMLNKLA